MQVNHKSVTSFPLLCAHSQVWILYGHKQWRVQRQEMQCSPHLVSCLELLAWQGERVLLHHGMGTCAEDVGASLGCGYIHPWHSLLLFWITGVPQWSLNLPWPTRLCLWRGWGREDWKGLQKGKQLFAVAEFFRLLISEVTILQLATCLCFLRDCPGYFREVSFPPHDSYSW